MKYKSVLIIALAIFLLDQITKYMIKTSMLLHESIPIIGEFFRLTFVENRGMAFGISFGHNIFFTIFAAMASVAILVYFFTLKGRYLLARIAMSMIFGGALGNLIDRIFRGSVVDFLDFEFVNINIPDFKLLFINFPGYSMTRWPVFNVADIAITSGMVLLLVFIAFDKESIEDSLPVENTVEAE